MLEEDKESMDTQSSCSDIVSAHDEYRRLLRKYQEARQTYEEDPSHLNWDGLRKALKRLKAHQEVMELKRIR